MQKTILFLFVSLPLFLFSQSNSIQTGLVLGNTPYLVEWSNKAIGYNVQYTRNINSKFLISMAFGQIVNHDSFHATFTNIEGRKFRYGLKGTEKSLYFDFDIEYAVLIKNRYTLFLGIGGSWFKDHFEYVKEVTFKDDIASTKYGINEVTSRMVNIVVENNIVLTNNFFLNLKAIVRRQFYDDHVLQYTTRNLEIGGSSQSSLVFIGNYNLILSVGYKF